ncbi:hypothetical protein ACQJBY_009276 [Aegilops geniculata]
MCVRLRSIDCFHCWRKQLFHMSSTPGAILSWNVRGLNWPARRATVREIAEAHRASILCLQETKLESWTPAIVRELGGGRLDGCAVLPATGTRGGVAVLWDKAVINFTTHAIGCFSITGKVTVLHSNSSFWLTTVYGPVDDARKDDFLAEMARAVPLPSEPWLINGDFNVIYEARDKNNLNLNRRIMSRFRAAIDTAGLHEIKCKNRRFTWTNERQDPTMVCIDKVFCNTEWDALFPSYIVMAAATACSDHCPLVLANTTAPKRKPVFRFEHFWPRFPRFQETVNLAWQRPVNHTCPIIRLKIKLKRAAHDLSIWARSHFSDAKLQFHLACEVILRLDVAQEKRALTPGEFSLRKQLKQRILGLAAIERARKRQASCITWLKEGDARSAFFQAKINSRRRKNFIHSLDVDNAVITAHDEKAAVAHSHFSNLLGRKEDRKCSFNWEMLDMPTVQNEGLDNPFSEDEVWAAILASPADRAPGPDGFSGMFFRACWGTIKEDVMALFHHLYNLGDGNFADLNTAMIALLPKKDGAVKMSDFRPISLIHSVAKLFSKVLSIRLANVIDKLITPAQTAFQRRKCIQDSFLYVQNTVRKLHRNKTPALLLKLDIAKAFDCVSWEYLLELLEVLGFPPRWRDWIALLLSTSSSSCLLNGVPGDCIDHLRGLRQGDPLSPLLFILCIDTLHRLLEAATSSGLLAAPPPAAARMRTSLYADDAVIFINPERDTIDTLLGLLQQFGDATGLRVNLSKSSAIPISCSGIDLATVLLNFGGTTVTFPITYLGLPITIGRIRLVHLQFILDRIRARLAGWKGRLMPMAGRRVLVRCVLSAIPTFALTALRAPKKLFKEIDKSRRRFLWAQDDEISGAKCKVGWKTVTTPEQRGGLGIHDLSKFARALRLRWLWLAWQQPHRPWVGTGTPCDSGDMALFAACTSVSIGNGTTASFWYSSWLGGRQLCSAFPALFAASIRKNRSVHEALHGDRWVLDLRHANSIDIVHQVIQLAREIRSAGLVMNAQTPDSISWTQHNSGMFSTKSAYNAQFAEGQHNSFRSLIWKIWAPGKIKMFLWFLHQDKLWCNDRLQRRGWANGYFCPLCLRNLESSFHLFWECPISLKVWNHAANWAGCQALNPAGWCSETTSTGCAERIINNAAPGNRKGIKSIMALIAWHIWLERNSCVFRGKHADERHIVEACRRDMEQWRLAGAKCMEQPFGDMT